MKSKIRKTAIGCLALILVAPVALVIFVCVMAVLNGRTDAPTDFSTSAALVTPQQPLTEPITLKLITYNVANAYLFATNRPERMIGLADKLKELDPDIVGLQEVFVEETREMLFDLLKDSRLKFHSIYPAATIGNGLLILSAYPIKESWFYRYEENNPFWKVWEGDFWAGKGVGLARVELPGGALLDFYDTHAQAGRNHPTQYLEVRSGQMTGLANFMNKSKCASGLAFVVGDFNTEMGRADLQIAIDQVKLQRLMNMDSEIDHIFGAEDPRYRFETLDTVEISGTVKGSHPELFLGRAPNFKEILDQFIGEGGMTSLSDHPGYMSTVKITPVGK